jgi:hypothetical protein
MVSKAQNKTDAHKVVPGTTEQIIAEMRQEDEAAERTRIREAMTPACREKLAFIETWFCKEVNHTLRSRYELGLQVKELYDDVRNNDGKVYGKHAIAQICKVLRWDDGVIRLALRFVQAFRPADLERLCAVVLSSGEPFSWSHARVLLEVKDVTKRQELLDQTVAEGWTCMELAEQVKHLEDHTDADGRGRPPKVPRDFDSAVAQQQQSAEQWDRRYSRVWSNENRSLVTHAAKLPPEEVTQERLYQARELAAQLRRVAGEALRQAEKAEQVVREFEQILDERLHAENAAQTAPSPKGKTRVATAEAVQLAVA